MNIAILITLAYLLGSIPTSVWVSKKVYGIDIREFGSGNAGTTNTFRVLGKKPGIFVFIIDVLKGTAAVELAHFSQYDLGMTAFVNLQVVLGLSAVVGHILPVFAKFKGGKGVATLFGMILGIHAIIAIALIGVFVAMLFLTRYVSLSSIVASVAFPLMILFIFKEKAPEVSYKVFAIATACMVVLTHHKNISRLLAGNESKVKIIKRRR